METAAKLIDEPNARHRDDLDPAYAVARISLLGCALQYLPDR
jgi:hypothetical protein